MISGNKRPTVFQALDPWVMGLFIAMLICGLFAVCGASYTEETEIFSFSSRSGMQLVWIGTALILAFVILLVDYDSLDSASYILYGVMMFILFITIFNPKQIHGSRSWLVLGPVQVQPAEFAKFVTALAVAKFMNSYGFNSSHVKHWFVPVAIVVFPMLLIIMQKETGSALVYLAFFLMFYREGMTGVVLFTGIALIFYFVVGIKYQDVLLWNESTRLGTFLVYFGILIFTAAMEYIYGKQTAEKHHAHYVSNTLVKMIIVAIVPISIIVSCYIAPFNVNIVLLLLIIVAIIYFAYKGIKDGYKHCLVITGFIVVSLGFYGSANYVLNDVMKPYQKARINVLVGLEEDLAGVGYNVHQSKIAIGSGGVVGKGFLKGTQTKLKYVPEQDTDFIYCTIGEEEGFLGCTFVLLLFLGFILRLIFLAERQVTRFARVYGYCVASIFIFHLLINIGMVLGITPVIGIPLPFFSYGGSSLWGFTILLFIFLRLDAERKISSKI